MSHKKILMLSICAFFAILGLGACALKETTAPGPTGGIAISVNDSSSVILAFKNLDPAVYADSGEFNLDEIRGRIADQGLNPDSLEITGLQFTYADITDGFTATNQGARFVIKIYTRERDGDPMRLTIESHDSSAAFKPLAFNPDTSMFALNTGIFANQAGFPGLLNAIKDRTKHKLRIIAELDIKDELKTPGALKLNMIVTVTGKV